MPAPRVLLDTNILLSGLVYPRGPEHRILELVESGRLTLVLPAPVFTETRRVLARKFPGFAHLFDAVVRRWQVKRVEEAAILRTMPRFAGRVRHMPDLPIFAALVLAQPRYFVTGDEALRADCRAAQHLFRGTEILQSRELLARLGEATP